MKRFFSALLIFVCLCLLFSCTQKKDFLVVGYTEGASFYSSISNDIDLSNERKVLDVDARTYETVINGERIVGQYEATFITPVCKCDADIYRGFASDGAEVSFWINRETKKTVLYSIRYPDGYRTKTDDRSYDDCLQIAKEVLASYDKDGQYTQQPSNTGDKPTENESRGKVYSYYFVKTALEKKTNIIVTIKVNTDGFVVEFNAQFEPSMDKNDIECLKTYVPDQEIDIKIKDEVLSLLKTELRDNADISNRDATYFKLNDGHLYVQYDVEIKIGVCDYIRLLQQID
jgi:hypothetical protein